MIDGTPLLLPGGGVKSYVYYWLQHLRRNAAPDETIDAFPLITDTGALDHTRSTQSRAATTLRLNIVRAANIAGSWVAGLTTGRADVFHETNTNILYPPRGPKLTATIHDMTCWLAPELHAAENVAFTKKFAREVLARADRLIAVSENTRRDAIDILRIPAERIQVIYSGVAEQFFNPAQRRILDRPYILFNGVIEPRKNVDTLIDAYMRMTAALRDEFDLVLAGPFGWHSAQIRARIEQAPPGVRHLSYVPEADIAALTAGAAVVVYPSLYEGFGLPIVQAMAAGVPVITSNVSSLPEVAGGAAELVNPTQTDEICAALERVLLNPSIAQELVTRGRARSAKFHWDACAAQSLAFFRAVAGSR